MPSARSSCASCLLCCLRGVLCVFPILVSLTSSFSQIMALFVHATDHRQRLFGRARFDSSIVGPVDARDRLRTIQRLHTLSDAQLESIMEALASWDIAFKLNDEEKLVYNRPNGGYLFPSMRQSLELLSLPMLPVAADVTSELWIAEQVRISSRQYPLLTHPLLIIAVH